jgi:hypothetical protein
MERVAKIVVGGGRSWIRHRVFVALFLVFATSAVAQTIPKPVDSGPVPTGPSLDAAKFTDVTSALNINFEYVASHTSRKYLIETMGSGVALFRL